MDELFEQRCGCCSCDDKEECYRCMTNFNHHIAAVKKMSKANFDTPKEDILDDIPEYAYEIG